MEPFSVYATARYPLVCVRAHTYTGVKSLSGNLYDGLNNYPAFSAQFVYEAESGRLTSVRITFALRSGCDEIVNCWTRFRVPFYVF